jgi:hypothetical protein
MTVTPSSITTSHQWAIQIEDGAGVTRTLPGVQGDPSLAEIMAGERATEAIRERGIIIGYVQTDEAEHQLTWSAVESAELSDFLAFAGGSGPVYGPAGTSPMVSVNPICSSVPAVHLRAIQTPCGGAPRVHRYETAILSYTPKGGIPSTSDVSFKASGHTVE